MPTSEHEWRTSGIADDPETRTRILRSRVAVVARAPGRRGVFGAVLVLVCFDRDELPVPDEFEHTGRELEEGHVTVRQSRRGPGGDGAASGTEMGRSRGRRGA